MKEGLLLDLHNLYSSFLITRITYCSLIQTLSPLPLVTDD